MITTLAIIGASFLFTVFTIFLIEAGCWVIEKVVALRSASRKGN